MNGEMMVEARGDHIASLWNATPLAALEELIWNALDADAREVRADVVMNGMGGIEAIRVTDDGTGVNVAELVQTFGSLGGSWKRENTSTPAFGRKLHGRKGQGRFKSFALGTHVEWRTTYRKADGNLESHVIAGDSDKPGLFTVREIGTGPAPGTEVTAFNVKANVAILLQTELVVRTLASRFALYLKAYPNVTIYFAGIPVTPVIVQKRSTRYAVRTSAGGEASLEVIEWRRPFPGAGKLVICGPDGFSLCEQAPGVRPGAPFWFTAYLVSERLAQLHRENALILEDLHPEVRAYTDGAKKLLRDHFKVLAATEAQERVASWIAEKSYPYDADDTSEARARFDEAASEMRGKLEGFDGLQASERAYLFGLLKASLKGA